MRKQSALSALFPGVRKDILLATFGAPERWFTLPDIADRLQTPADRLYRAVSALTAGGVLRQRNENGCRLFQADSDGPFFFEIQALVAKATVPPHAGQSGAILVVEDEPATLKIARILLESWGYTVLEAAGAEEALRVFRDQWPEIRLLLTDVIMPGMQGPELARRLRLQQPSLRVIFMSGYPSEDLAGGGAYLQKPFNPAGLAKLIREEMEKA